MSVNKVNLIAVRCPYCNDFWDYVVPENFFWGEEGYRYVTCWSKDCGKPFLVTK